MHSRAGVWFLALHVFIQWNLFRTTTSFLQEQRIVLLLCNVLMFPSDVNYTFDCLFIIQFVHHSITQFIVLSVWMLLRCWVILLRMKVKLFLCKSASVCHNTLGTKCQTALFAFKLMWCWFCWGLWFVNKKHPGSKSALVEFSRNGHLHSCQLKLMSAQGPFFWVSASEGKTY